MKLKEQAEAIRKHMDSAAEYLPDDKALEAMLLYPEWSGDSVNYATGDRRRYGDKLYKCVQSYVTGRLVT